MLERCENTSPEIRLPINLVTIYYSMDSVFIFRGNYSGMNVRIVYESSTTSNVVGLSVRHNNTRIHVRVRQEVGYRQHGGMILCQ